MSKRHLLVIMIIVVGLVGSIFVFRNGDISKQQLSSSMINTSALEKMTETQLRAYIAEQDALIVSTQSDITIYEENKKPAQEALKNFSSKKPVGSMTEAELRAYIAEQDALIAAAQANKLAAETALQKFITIEEPKCGINAVPGTYRSDLYNWPDLNSGKGFCASGKIVGTEPLFPIKLGSIASWKCRNERGPVKEINCMATKNDQATNASEVSGGITCSGVMSPVPGSKESTFVVEWTITTTVPNNNLTRSTYWMGTDFSDVVVDNLRKKTLTKTYFTPGIKELYVGIHYTDSRSNYAVKMARCAIQLVSPSQPAKSDNTLLPTCGVNALTYDPRSTSWADSVTTKGFCNNGVLLGSAPRFPQYSFGKDDFNSVTWQCVNSNNSSIKTTCSATQLGPKRYVTGVNTTQSQDPVLSISNCTGVKSSVPGSTTEDMITLSMNANMSAGIRASAYGIPLTQNIVQRLSTQYMYKYSQRYPKGTPLSSSITFLYDNKYPYLGSTQAITISCPTKNTGVSNGTGGTISTR